MDTLLTFVKYLYACIGIFLAGYEAKCFTFEEIMNHSGWFKRQRVGTRNPKPEKTKVSEPSEGHKNSNSNDGKTRKGSSSKKKASKKDSRSSSEEKTSKKKNIGPSSHTQTLKPGTPCATPQCPRTANKVIGGKPFCCGLCTSGDHGSQCPTGEYLVGPEYMTFDELNKYCSDIPAKPSRKLLPYQTGVYLPASFVRGKMTKDQWNNFLTMMPAFGHVSDDGIKFDVHPAYMAEDYYDTKEKLTKVTNQRRSRRSPLSKVLICLVCFLTLGDCMTIKATRSDVDVQSIEEVASMSKWQLGLDDARKLENNKSKRIISGVLVFPFPKVLEIVVPCSYEEPTVHFEGKPYAVSDACNQDLLQTYKIEFSSSYMCLEEPADLDRFEAMLKDRSCNCALVTDQSLLARIKRKYGRIELTRSFRVSTSTLVSTVSSWVQSEEGAFVGSERGMGIVLVDGKHQGTFFCHDGHAFTAWHVVDPYTLWGTRDPTVELCTGSCMKVDDVTKIGHDVARIVVPPNWCRNPKLRSSKPTAVAYTRKKEKAVMDVIISSSGSEAVLTVAAGTWAKGMSGGPLFVDRKPVGVITAMRGIFFTQQLLVYGLDGKPFAGSVDDEL